MREKPRSKRPEVFACPWRFSLAILFFLVFFLKLYRQCGLVRPFFPELFFLNFYFSGPWFKCDQQVWKLWPQRVGNLSNEMSEIRIDIELQILHLKIRKYIIIIVRRCFAYHSFFFKNIFCIVELVTPISRGFSIHDLRFIYIHMYAYSRFIVQEQVLIPIRNNDKKIEHTLFQLTLEISMLSMMLFLKLYSQISNVQDTFIMVFDSNKNYCLFFFISFLAYLHTALFSHAVQLQLAEYDKCINA